MAKTCRARINAENGHRRVTRPRLRVIEAEKQGYSAVYLRAPSGTIEYDRGSRGEEVGCETAIIPCGLWLRRRKCSMSWAVRHHSDSKPARFVACFDTAEVRFFLAARAARTEVFVRYEPGSIARDMKKIRRLN